MATSEQLAEQQAQQEAQKQKQQKLQLEAAMTVLLIRLLNKMSKSAISFYTQNGQIIDLNQFSRQLAAVLQKSYDKTNKIFSASKFGRISMTLPLIL